MSGKPFQSSLLPYKEEIFTLRLRKPPVPYSRIAEILCEKYKLRIRRETIFKFVKVRCQSKKTLRYRPDDRKVSKTPTAPAPSLAGNPESPPRPPFIFTPSNRYNLKRLPPEEAAAIRKKLEAEGH